MIGVKVDHGARVDLEDLRNKLQVCLDNKESVYAVVAIIGSTEEGSVDPLVVFSSFERNLNAKVFPSLYTPTQLGVGISALCFQKTLSLAAESIYRQRTGQNLALSLMPHYE